MNLHGSAHLPIVPVVVAGVGLLVLFLTNDRKATASELGKALLWGGAFAALFAAAGSCS